MNSAARRLRVAACTATILFAAGLAFAAAGKPAGDRAERLAPLDYRPADGPVAMARAADGSRWAAWSYARGLETDIAVAFEVGSVWSGAVLLDPDNGLVDDQPAIAFLPDGRPLVAWRQHVDGGPGRIVGSILTAGSWSAPVALTPEGTDASQPRLLSVEQGLLLVWIADGRRAVSQSITPAATVSPATRQAETDSRGGTDNVIPGNPTGKDPEADSGSNGPDPMPTRNLPPEDPDRDYSTKSPEDGARRLR